MQNQIMKQMKTRSKKLKINQCLKADLDVNEFRMEEQLFDTESDQQSSENIVQKLNNTKSENEYKIFTKEFDEIEKAENLEEADEILKLKKKS